MDLDSPRSEDSQVSTSSELLQIESTILELKQSLSSQKESLRKSQETNDFVNKQLKDKTSELQDQNRENEDLTTVMKHMKQMKRDLLYTQKMGKKHFLSSLKENPLDWNMDDEDFGIGKKRKAGSSPTKNHSSPKTHQTNNTEPNLSQNAVYSSSLSSSPSSSAAANTSNIPSVDEERTRLLDRRKLDETHSLLTLLDLSQTQKDSSPWGTARSSVLEDEISRSTALDQQEEDTFTPTSRDFAAKLQQRPHQSKQMKGEWLEEVYKSNNPRNMERQSVDRRNQMQRLDKSPSRGVRTKSFNKQTRPTRGKTKKAVRGKRTGKRGVKSQLDYYIQNPLALQRKK